MRCYCCPSVRTPPGRRHSLFRPHRHKTGNRGPVTQQPPGVSGESTLAEEVVAVPLPDHATSTHAPQWSHTSPPEKDPSTVARKQGERARSPVS
jgi:hypothetical protein